jgi:hypothetical protein
VLFVVAGTMPSARLSAVSQAPSRALCSALNLCWTEPTVAHERDAVAHACEHLSGDVDQRHGADNAVEIRREALRHGDAFAPGFHGVGPAKCKPGFHVLDRFAGKTRDETRSFTARRALA